MQPQKRNATCTVRGGACRSIRFPVPAERPTGKRRLPRLGDLLARRWRRVVIQGQHYWLPD